MGNAVISGILFQPPAPPMALPEVLGPNDQASGAAIGGAYQKTPPIRKRSHNISVDYLWLYSADERNEMRLIPAIHITHTDVGQMHPTVGGNSKRYTLLYSHGNAEDLGLISSFLVDLARLLQVNVLCYDYSGYGMGADEPSVAEFFEAHQKDVESWKVHRINGDDGLICVRRGSERGCRYTRNLFVVPFIRPPASGEAINGMDAARKEEEEDDDAASYFTNACSVTIDDATGEDPADERRRSLLEKHAWSAPSPSETSCYADIQSAYDYLTTVEGVPPQHVILYGKSVGSGPTCWLAQRLCQTPKSGSGWDRDSMCSGAGDVESREPVEGNDRREGGNTGSSDAPGGVVLHSPFLSVIRVVLDVGFTTIGDLFPNIDRVGDFTCPTYVIHGSNDGIVPFSHGQTLFQNIRGFLWTDVSPPAVSAPSKTMVLSLARPFLAVAVAMSTEQRVHQAPQSFLACNI